jgi:hypothetical protein
MVKYPHIEGLYSCYHPALSSNTAIRVVRADYRLAVRELDAKEYLNLKLRYIDLRNMYSSLYDLLTKNEEKIKVSPQSAPFSFFF